MTLSILSCRPLTRLALCVAYSILPITMAHADEDRGVSNASGPISALTALNSLKNQPIAAVLRTPAVTDFKTKSGTRVLFVAAPELPIVDIRLTFDAGSARDTEIGAGLFGLASLTAKLLDEGTSTQSTDDIAARFESLGAQYGASAYRDMFTVDLRTLADDEHVWPAVDQLLALLKDAQFPQVSIDRVFQNAAIGQKQREESPAALGSIRFWRELYGTHPYAEPTSGTQTSLRKITPAHIRQFKDKFLVSGNLNVAITGQLSVKQARILAEKITQGLPVGQHASPLATPSALTAARTVSIPFASSQTHVMMGQLGVRRDDPDLPALTVGNEVLGGGDFNARLMKELREKRGMTYGAYSGFSPMRSNGPFTISYSTRADQAAESIQVARQTLIDYVQNGADPTALQEAQEGILNGYPISLSSNASINAYLSMMGFYGLPASYLADYPKAIAAVTPDAVRAAFNRHVQPDRLLTVVVGQPLTPPNKTEPAPLPQATPASQPATDSVPASEPNDMPTNDMPTPVAPSDATPNATDVASTAPSTPTVGTPDTTARP